MPRAIRLLILLCLCSALIGTSTAQDTGQICIMSYEDRDGDGNFDENEPPVMQGIGVNLLSGLGITVATKVLEASTDVVPGLVCVGELPGGEYHVLLTSAQFEATTDSSFDAVVAPGSAPVRFDFGVQPIPVVVETEAESPRQLTEEQLQGLQNIGIGLIASVMISPVLLLIGWLIYWLIFRRRLRRIRAQQRQRLPNPPRADQLPGAGTAPSSTPARTMTPPARFEPGQGSPLLFADDETSPNPVA